MTYELKIRRATIAEVDQIVRLVNDGGPDGKPNQSLPDILPDAYVTAFKRIDQNPNQALMVVLIDDNVIGTFHLTFLTYLAGAGQDDCQIEAVHVDRSWRGRGIGEQMMRRAIGEAKQRNCRRVQLTTNKRRKDAHRFYERLGFTLSHEGAKLDLTVRA